jgi:O-antigen ligase
VKRTALESRAPEICAGYLLVLALATIQIFVGGTRLLFSLPAYSLIAVGGVLLQFALRRVKPDPDQVCLTVTVVFFAYILVRAFLSPVAYLARIDSYSVLGGLLVYFLVACFLTDSKQRIILLFLLLIFGVVHVLVGAIQFRNDDNFMPISFLQRFDYERRASGFYVCPNHLAGLLEVLGIFGLSITFWSRLPVWAKLISAYATVICYFGLILTGSRGGYLSAVGSLLVFLVLSGLVLRQVSGRFLLRIGGPAVIAAVVVLAAFFFIHKNAYLSDRAQNMFEKNVRLKMWSAAIEQWKLRPLFGTGSGTYLYYGRQFRTPELQTDPVYVHNDYLQLLAEYGLAGGALFLIFLGGHLTNGWKNFRRLALKRVAVSSRLVSNATALQLGAIPAVVAYMIHSFLDFNLHIPANVLLLAFVFGVLANAGARHQAELPEVRRSIFAWRLVLPAIALLVAVQAMRLLPAEYFAERARAALRDDQLEIGAAFALRGLAWERNNPNLYQYLGSARFDQADRTSMSDASATQFYEEALVAFETAYALAPREEAFAIGMADSYDALGRFNEGEWMYEEALGLDPRSTSLATLYQAHLKKWRDSGTKELDKAAAAKDSNEPQ